MLGVIAIHVGSMAVSDAVASPFLVLITNILSRYSVPAFFFISGYGLFYSKPLEEPLQYGSFVKKRMESIGRPYLLASLFYLCYYALLNRDASVLDPSNILFSLFFGTAQYHIYFLVILIWFYLLFPMAGPDGRDGKNRPEIGPASVVCGPSAAVRGEFPVLGLS